MAVTTAHVEAANKAAVLPTTLVGVFVGATSGIGRQSARIFARLVEEPTVYIVGRNEAAGAEVVAELRAVNAKTTAYFIRADVSLIAEGDRVVQEITSRESKVNTVVVLSGYLATGGFTPNAEGTDGRLGVNYYGRWAIIDGLVLLLDSAAAAGEPARVVSVLHAYNTLEIKYRSDLELKEPGHYSVMACQSHTTTLNSLACERFARVHPGVLFSHTYPGFVNTGIGRSLPWYLRLPFTPIAGLFFRAPEEVGERTVYVALTGDEFGPSGHAHLVDANSGTIPQLDKLTVEELDWAWTETVKVLERIRASARA